MKLISWCFSSKWRFGHPGTRGAATYFSHQRNGRRRKLNQIGSLLTPHLLMIKTRSCTWYFLFSAWKIEIFFPKEISLLNVRNTVNIMWEIQLTELRIASGKGFGICMRMGEGEQAANGSSDQNFLAIRRRHDASLVIESHHHHHQDHHQGYL